MSTSTDLRQRAENDLKSSRQLLQLIESGDAIVGSTPRSRALRKELAARVATLERLLAQKEAA